MKVKQGRKCIISFFLLCILLLTSVFSMANAVELQVKKVRKAKPNWCWAACCEMIGDWAGHNVTRDQWDVVRYIKGSSAPDVSGTLEDTRRGSNYMIENTSSASVWTFYSSNSPFGWPKVETYISDKDHPIIAGLRLRDSSGQLLGGHMILLCGTDSNYNRVLFVDPDSGTTRWCPFPELMNGSAVGGYKYEETVYY